MIKAIIFDWGGVLIDNPSGGLQRYCAEVLGIDMDIFRSAFARHKDEFQDGTIREADMWKNVCNEIGIDMSLPESLWYNAVQDTFNEKEKMFNLVERLRIRGYKIGFLSNTEMPAVEYWKRNDYAKYFDEAVFSCIEHIAKPDREIYQMICERLRVVPEETVFIDDKDEYVDGAKSIGMGGIVFKTVEQVKLELELLLENN